MQKYKKFSSYGDLPRYELQPIIRFGSNLGPRNTYCSYPPSYTKKGRNQEWPVFCANNPKRPPKQSVKPEPPAPGLAKAGKQQASASPVTPGR